MIFVSVINRSYKLDVYIVLGVLFFLNDKRNQFTRANKSLLFVVQLISVQKM